MAPPGMPKTMPAPTCSSDLTRDCAPVNNSGVVLDSDIACSLPVGSRPDPEWMLRLCYAGSSSQRKTPAARRQTRERVGAELHSADTPAHYEDSGAVHNVTVGANQPEDQRAERMS